MVWNLFKFVAYTTLTVAAFLFFGAYAKDVDTVMLTINVPADSDPNEMVALLDVLESREIPATFFVTGAWALENRDLTYRIDGLHEVGCFTMSEARLAPLNGSALEREIVECKEVFDEMNIEVFGFRAPSNDVGASSYPIIAEHFVYDSSLYGRYEWFWEKPPSSLVEIPVTSVLVMPLDSYFGIDIFRLGDLFFSIARRAKQDVVVMAMDVDRAHEYLLDLEYLFAFFKKEGASVTTINQFLQGA